MKRHVDITIDEEIYEQFKKYCTERAMKVSPKIELLIKGVLQK